MPRGSAHTVRLSRRRFLKAAAIAGGALSGLVVKNANAQWDHGGDNGGRRDIGWGWDWDRGEGGDDDDDEGRGRGRHHDRDDDWHCFLRGTLIRGPDGYRPIEALVAGELLPTGFSGTAAIRKIIRFAVCRDERGRWPEKCRPVRISAGAFAENIPFRDMFLTHTHALFLDGVLVPVGSLINGKTISFDERPDLDVLEYFHVEFDSHDVFDAQGMLSESHNDGTTKLCAPLALNGGRSMFYSHLRSAIAPIVDRRRPLDRLRDALEARGGL